MGRREDLESALARAEAELALAVAARAEAHANVAEADAKLERARAVCRHLHDSLVELIRAEPPRAVEAKKPAEALPESTGDDAVPVGKRLRGTLQEFLAGLRVAGSRAVNAAGGRALARQSFMLLALVLAYLQYYFFDVNLQVSRMPSITVMVFG